MQADRVVGLLITVGYTFVVWLAVQPDASGAMIDASIWMAYVLLVLSGSLFAITDAAFLSLSGGSKVRGVRYVCLGLQISLFVTVGWWWTIAARLAAEGLAFRRLLLAWSRPMRGFKVDKDDQGQFFIHCFECGRASYNRNDIEQLYCGCCNKYHGYRNDDVSAT